ncbi:MAG: nucleotidyltransferase [Verrucomicrobiota bacterium]
MEKLPPDFRDFLNLLNEHQVEYLLVGGHAVALHGYPRFTSDMDIWIAVSEQNATRLVGAIREFGFENSNLSEKLFLNPDRMTRMGREPMRIEILNSISGVEFPTAFSQRVVYQIENVEVPVISLKDLRANKNASGRLKDQLDLENLPDS